MMDVIVSQAKYAQLLYERDNLRSQNAELLTVLKEIADLRYSNTSAASIAQSALDTMRALEEK
jgi:hypothetical protein